MTVSNDDVHTSIPPGNSPVSEFDLNFRVEDPDHVDVIVTDKQDAKTRLKAGDGYTIQNPAASGNSTLKLASPLAVGSSLDLFLKPPFTQPLDLQNQGAFYAEDIEKALDLVTRQSIYLKNHTEHKDTGNLALHGKLKTVETGANRSLQKDDTGHFDAGGSTIRGLPEPTQDSEAATMGWVIHRTAMRGPQGEKGPDGDRGQQGIPGDQGIPGVQGPAGVKGDQGDQGPTGLRGPQGPTGDQGPQGVEGPEGPQGPQGVPGPQGDQGIRGPEGVQGPAGVQGPQGPQGAEGPMGEAYEVDEIGLLSERVSFDAKPEKFSFLDVQNGTIYWKVSNTPGHWSAGTPFGRGPIGAQGPQGPQGPKGEKGDIGPQGPQGVQGVKGDAGPKGDTGATGPKGDRGATGTQGVQGDTGPQGPQGIQGVKGETGIQGPTGPTGPAGPEGPKGDKGIIWRGDWSAATAYVANDLVYYNGSAYIALASSSNKAPPASAAEWHLVARAGDGSNHTHDDRYYTKGQVDGRYLRASQTATISSHWSWADGKKIGIGDDGDLEFLHNAHGTFITNKTGTLQLRQHALNEDVHFETKDIHGTVYYPLSLMSGHYTILRYGSGEKLSTQQWGVKVTGELKVHVGGTDHTAWHKGNVHANFDLAAGTFGGKAASDLNVTVIESPQLALANVVSFSHGLGYRPRVIWAELECIHSDLGYSVGERVHQFGAENDFRWCSRLQSTATEIRFANAGGGYLPVPHKNGGDYGNGRSIPPGDPWWRLRLCALEVQ